MNLIISAYQLKYFSDNTKHFLTPILLFYMERHFFTTTTTNINENTHQHIDRDK